MAVKGSERQYRFIYSDIIKEHLAYRQYIYELIEKVLKIMEEK